MEIRVDATMRAERRHHRERLKQARHLHWGDDLRGDPRELGRVINTPTPCSCFMCGNPRRRLKLKTVQELSSEELERLESATTEDPHQ